jgi:CHAT domain-containing protein
MREEVLTLDFTRVDRGLKVSVFEGDEKPLRPYEVHTLDWRQCEERCQEVLALLNRANARLNTETLNDLAKSGRVLFDLLIPSQAKAKLAHTSARFLTLRLDDSLVHIPWELVHDGSEFFCRRFVIGRIASTRQAPTARSIRTPAAPYRVLIIADPRGDLEGAYREGLEIKSSLDRQRDVFHVDFKSRPVDLAFVKKNLRDYDIVHYAGHAEYNVQNPSESGWLLSDGTLKAGEIAAMGGLQPMPALVFSNACRSGQTGEWRVGDDVQPIFGLANAFLLSGVQCYVGAFCNLVDEHSAKFAERFYAAIAAGEGVGTALHRARQEASSGAGAKSFAWTNYMLYGDPRYGFGADRNGEIPQDHRRAKPPRRRKMLPDRLRGVDRRTAGIFSFLTILLLASGYGGYTYFNPNDKEIAASETQLGAPQLMPVSALMPAPAPLTLTMNIIGQRKEPDGGYTEVFVREGSVLQSRDHFQVHVETNKPSHIYVLLFDSQGRASQLFPDPKIEQAGFIEAGRRIAIPDKDLWFWLDENQGTETVYVLASETPLTDIRQLLTKMNNTSDAERKRVSSEIKQQIQIVERGVGGVAKGKTVSYALGDGRHIQKVTDVVAGTNSVVRAISFHHK